MSKVKSKRPKEKVPEVLIPKEISLAYAILTQRAYGNLSTENFDIFWKDIFTAMENRLKVLEEIEAKNVKTGSTAFAC